MLDRYYTEEQLVEFKNFDGDINKYKEYLKTNKDEMDLILSVVCSEFNVPISHVALKTRLRNVVLVRQFVHYFAYFDTNIPIGDIGSRCGSVDHTTVLYSAKTIVNMIETDIDFSIRALNISNTLFSHGIRRIHLGQKRSLCY